MVSACATLPFPSPRRRLQTRGIKAVVVVVVVALHTGVVVRCDVTATGSEWDVHGVM